jgi:Domain of unknown function (DUF2828)
LYKNHPRTAIQNLHLLVEPVCTRGKSTETLTHGYWKDLLNILALAALDQLSTETAAHFLHAPKARAAETGRVNKKPSKKVDKDPAAVAARLEAHHKYQAKAKADAKAERVVAAKEAYDNLLEKLADKKFLALYITVARLFAVQLTKDWRILKQLETLGAGEDRSTLTNQISLAGKWAPTPLASHDRQTNIATAISLLLHNNNLTVPHTFPSATAASLSPAETYELRSWYQRSVLTPIRSATALPEPLMSANRWKDIKYGRVASKCMKNNTGAFYFHDPEGFERYLTDVESGKKKISGATLMPHELVAQAIQLNTFAAFGNQDEDEKVDRKKAAKTASMKVKAKMGATQKRVVEAQWKTLIDRLRESGTLDNCMAICDVSGSMGSISHMGNPKRPFPILPAVSLSLVLAQLAKPPFDNGFITFSANPQFIQLDPTKGLAENVLSIVKTPWSMNTNFNAVFLDLLLPLAQKNNLKQEDMIKRLFVFSDMQFDSSLGSSKRAAKWETNHDHIEKKYKEAGYEVPQIVYWNLAESFMSVPVTAEKKGVALMSGFSPAMLKVFMGEAEEDAWEKVKDDRETETMGEDDDEFNPVNIMKKALLKKCFDGLVVVD